MLKAQRPSSCLVFALALSLVLCTVAVQARDHLAGEDKIPYGAASDYLVGRQLLKEGNYSEALGYLHLVYRTHPDVPAVAEDFQEALTAEGYFQDALGVLDRLVSAYPDSLSYLLTRSNLNLQLNNTDQALADLRTVREKGGVNPEVIMAEANILAGRDEVSQALDVFRDGIELLPEHGDQFYLGMASLMQRDQQLGKVPPLLEQAVKEYPDNPHLQLVWMRSLALTEQHARALEVARRADEVFLGSGQERSEDPVEEAAHLAPGTPLPPDSFLVELADFYVQQGQVARAVSILKGLSDAGELQLTPSLWLARIYLGTGQEEQGRVLVEEILRRWPETARAFFLKGKLEENRGEWSASIPHYRRAVDLDPTDSEIRLALVRSMLVAWESDLSAAEPDPSQQEKRQLLEDHAVMAVTLVPHQDAEGQLVLGYAFRTLDDPWRAESCFELAAAKPDLRINALTQRSICFDEMGDPEKARRVLEGLHQEFPRHPEVANSLGYFLAEKGIELEKAVDLIQIALDSDPGNGAFLDSMGWAQYRLGQTETAFDYMIQAVNVLPDDPVILEHLGMVLLELGQKQEATDILLRSLALGGDAERIQAVLTRLGGEDKTSDSGTSRQAP